MKKIKGVVKDLSSKIDSIEQQNEAVTQDERQINYLEKIDSSIKKMGEKDGIEALRMISILADDISNDPELIHSINDFYRAVSLIPDKDKNKTIAACTKTINERFAAKDKEVQLPEGQST